MSDGDGSGGRPLLERLTTMADELATFPKVTRAYGRRILDTPETVEDEVPEGWPRGRWLAYLLLYRQFRYALTNGAAKEVGDEKAFDLLDLVHLPEGGPDDEPG